MRTRPGFTLVELLIVVAIIGVLSTIAVPTFRRLLQKSRQAEAKVHLGAIYTAEVAFRAEYEYFGNHLLRMGVHLENNASTDWGYWSGFMRADCTCPVIQPDQLTADGAKLQAMLPSYYVIDPTQADCGFGRTYFSECKVGDVGPAPYTTFTAISHGAIFSQHTPTTTPIEDLDIWTIDETHALKNTQSGIKKYLRSVFMITVYGIGAFLPQLKGLVRDIRVVWTLEELGLPYQRKVMDATKGEHKQPEYLAINPFGRVPAIQDGDFTLFESSAICSYLGDKVGKLLPAAGTRERVIYDQWISYVTSTFEVVAARIAWLDFFNEKNEVTLKLRADTLKSVEIQAAALDQQLATRPYLLGEAFSIADIQLASVARVIAHTEVTARLPHFHAYLEHCFARPAFARALENNG